MVQKQLVITASVEFLGQHVSAEGNRVLGAHVAPIAAHPKPSTKLQLMIFLGMLNFYRRYLKGAASILKPLKDATRGVGGKHSKLEWTKVMEKAFMAAKAALTDATHLAHPLEEAKLSLPMDASIYQIGATLQQKSPRGEWQPLSFFGRKLTDTKTRELLTVVAALRHFHFLLEGAASTCSPTTSHWVLLSTDRARDAWSAHQGRHLAYVAEFTSYLCHMAGAVHNVVANCLLGPLRSSPCPGIPS